MTRHRNYIGRELFRVSYEDMGRTVGLPVVRSPASANADVPSPNVATPYQQHLSAHAHGPPHGHGHPHPGVLYEFICVFRIQ